MLQRSLGLETHLRSCTCWSEPKEPYFTSSSILLINSITSKASFRISLRILTDFRYLLVRVSSVIRTSFSEGVLESIKERVGEAQSRSLHFGGLDFIGNI
jgi:hypothetical protein